MVLEHQLKLSLEKVIQLSISLSHQILYHRSELLHLSKSLLNAIRYYTLVIVTSTRKRGRLFEDKKVIL
jgi:hypothetical protein